MKDNEYSFIHNIIKDELLKIVFLSYPSPASSELPCSDNTEIKKLEHLTHDYLEEEWNENIDRYIHLGVISFSSKNKIVLNNEWLDKVESILKLNRKLF